MRSDVPLRPALAAVVLSLAAPLWLGASGQVLVRSSSSPAWFVGAGGVETAASATEITPSARVSVILQSDGLSPQTRQQAEMVFADLFFKLLEEEESGSEGGLAWLVQSGGRLTSAPGASAFEDAGFFPDRVVSPDDWIDALSSLPAASEEWESLLVLAEPVEIEDTEAREYIQARISRLLLQKGYRVFFHPLSDGLAPGGDVGDSLWAAAVRSTCGEILPEPLASGWAGRPGSASCTEVEVPEAPIPFGFYLHRAELWTDAPGSYLELPVIATAPGTRLPGLAEYEQMLGELQRARALRDGSETDPALEAVQRVLATNPLQPEARRLGAGIYREREEWMSALELLEPLRLLSDDARLERELGDLDFELGDWEASETHYRRSLDLEPEQPEVLARLSRVREEGGDIEGAIGLAARAAEAFPGRAEPSVRLGLLRESADDPAGALASYARARESEPAYEPGYYEAARLLARLGRNVEAGDVLAAGLAASPSSIRLHVLRIDLLESEGRWGDLRAAVTEARSIDGGQDERVQSRVAFVSDLFGDQAGQAYLSLSEELLESGARSEAIDALKRGVVVALRDGDRPQAQSMTQKLSDLGDEDFPILEPNELGDPRPLITVPGGVAGLAVAVGLRTDIDPERFVAAYARQIVRARRARETRRSLEASVRFYLELVAALRTEGEPTQSGDVSIRLDPSPGAGLQKVRRVLGQLGWSIRTHGQGFEVELGSEPGDASRQGYASVLSIDGFGMKVALERGEPFVLAIRDAQVPLIEDERFWLTTLLEGTRPERSLFEEMVDRPELPLLYVAFDDMTPETIGALVRLVPAGQLRKYAGRLALFGPGLEWRDGQIVLPGGPDAGPGWEALAGQSPQAPAGFLARLLERDGGKLLAYYAQLSAVPIRTQQFFTYSPARLVSFYDAFTFETRDSVDASVRKDEPFGRLASNLPLTDSGAVAFPGSARVWVTVNRASGSIDGMGDRIDDLLSRFGDAPATDAGILLEMLARSNGAGSGTEVFLAVAGVDAGRRRPMDEPTALALAGIYPELHSAFPYFEALPALGAEDVRSFARAARRLTGFGGNDLNTALGEFHSLIELIILLNRAGALSEDVAGSLFGDLTARFAAMNRNEELAGAAFEATRQMLRAAGYGESGQADEFLARALSGAKEPSGGPAADMIQVLSLQSVGSLENLLEFYRSLTELPGAPSTAISAMEAALPGLVEITPDEADRLSRELRARLVRGRPEEVARTVSDLAREESKEKPSESRISRLTRELLGQLNPFLETTLTGWVYASHFSPDDLVITVDRYFLRRHQFYGSSQDRDPWPETALITDPLNSGAYVRGGFAQIGPVAGAVAITRSDFSGPIDVGPGQGPLAAAQLGALRTVPWHRISDHAVAFVASRLQLGREILVMSALDRRLRPQVDSSLVGLLGPGRRREALEALERYDIVSALKQFSSSDLFVMVGRLDALGVLEGLPGPVLRVYRREEAMVAPEEVEYLSGYRIRFRGEPGGAGPEARPYEEYTNRLFADPLAERLSHLTLDLAESVYRAGLAAETLGLLAEPAAREFVRNARMADTDDWRAVLTAMRSLDLPALASELPGSPR